jgi:peptidoglycan/xylan/chitin deacetylase (PgdA/CDA1 family)
MNNFTQILSDRGKYSQLLSTVVEITNYGQLPNLSFNVLIADPARAFKDEKYASAYNQNFVTVDEFSKILDQLYANGYVLVNFDSFVEKTTDAAGNVSYTTKPIYLPSDKKPFMLTETLVNYFGYMIDSDNDGKADAKGGGFASKMIVKDGEITCEMVDAEGNTVYGAYDLVPILNEFIEEHPDFAYRGARATLAVTGKEGIFGHRINKGDSAAVAAATELVQELRSQGYLIACNTYENLNYDKNKATDIQADLKSWTDEIAPVLGDVDILVFARGSDISDYTGPKFNVLYSSGFRFFVSATSKGIPSTEVNRTYIRQYRIMVTGSLMVNSPSTLSNYFKVADVISGERGF